LFSLFEFFKKYNLLFDFGFANGHALLGSTSKILLIFSLAACILLLSRSQQKHVTVFDLCFAEIETAFSAHDVPV